MQISFFEEFPTKENLAKIKLVPFPTRLYLAALSLREFQSIHVPSKKVKENIYWPILRKKEGYWFSPFSERKALLRTLHDIHGSTVPILWDAELPTHTNLFLYMTQCRNFFRNRKQIRSFVAQRKNMYTAEYFPSSPLSRKLLYFLGVSFSTATHFPVKMLYSSMHTFSEDHIRAEISSAQETYGKRLRIALGTLTHGIHGDEPAIDPKILLRDLRIVQQQKVQEVILYRLGGLNKEYLNILKPFTQ